MFDEVLSASNLFIYLFSLFFSGSMKGKGRDKQYAQNTGNSQALQDVNPKEDDACFSAFKILQQQRENKGSVCVRVFMYS